MEVKAKAAEERLKSEGEARIDAENALSLKITEMQEQMEATKVALESELKAKLEKQERLLANVEEDGKVAVYETQKSITTIQQESEEQLDIDKGVIADLEARVAKEKLRKEVEAKAQAVEEERLPTEERLKFEEDARIAAESAVTN